VGVQWSVSLILANTKHFFVHLQWKESDYGVRSYTEVVGWKTSPKTGNTFTSDWLLEAVRESFVGHSAVSHWLLFLNFSLNVVKWKREEGSAEGWQHRGLDLSRPCSWALSISLRDLFFGSLVRYHHSNIQGNSSWDGRNGTSPEAFDTLFSDDSLKSVSNTSVVSALCWGQDRVSLHTY